MSRRSWTTLQNTERARRAAGDQVERERSDRTRLGHMLSAQPSFALDHVRKRLDDADARDRTQTEMRLAAAAQRLDLGDDD